MRIDRLIALSIVSAVFVTIISLNHNYPADNWKTFANIGNIWYQAVFSGLQVSR